MQLYITTYYFPFFMHDSGKKAITFEYLLAQIQNQNRSILYGTAIHLRSNKWSVMPLIVPQNRSSRTICGNIYCHRWSPGPSMAAIAGLPGPSVVPYVVPPCHKWSPLNYPYRNDVCNSTMGRATNNHYHSLIASCNSYPKCLNTLFK